MTNARRTEGRPELSSEQGERIKVNILLPNLVSGGGQRIVINFFFGLDRDIFAPTLIVQEKLGSFLEEVERRSSPGEVVFLLDTAYTRSRLPFLIKETMHYAREADIVIGALEGRSAYCGLIAAKLTRKPFVGWIHIDWRPFYERVSWRQTLSLRAYVLADQLVSCSKGAAESFADLFHIPPAKIKTIYNFLPCDLIRSLAEEPLPSSQTALFSKRSVLMVGRLDEQKGYPYLIEAHAKLISEGMDHNLILVGEGDEWDALQALTRKLGVEGSVHFLGFQSNPYRYMNHADVFVLSSKFEGFGLVLAEALVCGLPSISTDCPSGPAEILEGGKYGLLVPPADADSLADAIRRMLTDDELRGEFASLAPERGNAFDEKNILSEWTSLLKNVVRRT